MSRIVRLSTLLVVVALFLFGGAPVSATSCISDSRASMNEIDGIYVCSFAGGGCSSCFSRDPRGGGSWDLCYYDWATGDLHCTYYL